MTDELDVTQDTGAEEYVSALSLSDEEFEGMEYPDPQAGEAEPEGEPEEEESDTTEDGDADDAGEPPGDPGESEEADEEELTDAEAEDADPDEDKDKDESADTDYKAEYTRLMAPFRANGKEMKVASVDEAIELMQMGANYNKKMAALKPSLKTLKLLENNGLLEEEKLGYLIDLDKKNPDAIKKLIKESGLDPLDMDVEDDSNYKPNTYTVDDREMALDTVLEEIRDTPSYSETVNIVSNKWDGSSKRHVADNPQLLKVLNTQVANGIYGRISEAVEKERVFGRLTGVSDLEAYQQIGDALHAKGGFDDLFKPQDEEAPPRKVQPKPKAQDAAVKSKKRAASSTKTTPTATQASDDYSPLAMSDEDFEKQFNAKFL